MRQEREREGGRAGGREGDLELRKVRAERAVIDCATAMAPEDLRSLQLSVVCVCARARVRVRVRVRAYVCVCARVRPCVRACA